MLQTFIDRIDRTKLKGVRGIVEVVIEGNANHILVEGGELTLVPGPVIAPTVSVSVSQQNFDKLMSGKLGMKWAYVSGKVKITGDRKLLERLL